MKTIEVSDEAYEFLKECQNEIKTQDNRATRNPIYTVWQKKREWGIDPDFSEGAEFIWDDMTFTREDIIPYLYENGYQEELANILKEIEAMDIDCPDSSKEILTEEDVKKIEDYFKDMMNSEYELASLLSEYVNSYIHSVGYRVEDHQVVNGTCFSFFEKDAYDHIKTNGHNISGEKHTYADSLYRAPRMEKLLEILKSEMYFYY